ncbi:MAG: hypothetical protein AAGJ86_01975 [Pseudomonadota bacterium]
MQVKKKWRTAREAPWIIALNYTLFFFPFLVGGEDQLLYAGIAVAMWAFAIFVLVRWRD